MSKNRVDHAPGSGKPADPIDVHDIRALTATGAITLPQGRQRRKTDDGKRAE